MNPTDELQRSRFFRSVESSFRGLEWARQQTRSLVEEYAGNGYGAGRVRFESVCNLLHQTVDAYTMSLVANRPRVLISTQDTNLQYFAKQYEVALNGLISEIGLEYTMRQWVLDAFFCLGIVKVHMADAGVVQLETDLWADPGKPFASNVSIDNFVYDLGARKFSEVKYAGDMYRIPFEDLKSGIFDQSQLDELQPTSKYAVDSDRLDRISRGLEVDFDEHEPMIDLADIWVPRDGKIYTFAVSRVAQFQLKGAPLAVMDWTGPEFGPYHLLGFNDVPENIMPTSPASHLAIISRLVNNIMRKQAKRAKNQRNIHLYEPANANSVKKAKIAGDDEFVEAITPKDNFTTISVGGVDGNLQNFATITMDLYDRMAGNLTAMLGLGAQADTKGQEELIHGAVSKKVANMQYRVVDGAVRLIRNLGHMLWHDKFKVIRGQFPVEGAEGYQVDATWTPEDREGDFYDYDFNIDLYSMPYQSPQAKMGSIIQALQTVHAPFMQLLQAQGGTLDIQELNSIMADMLNAPELRRIIKFTTPQEPTGGEGESAPQPSTTTRNYVRKSSGGGQNAPQSQAHQMKWESNSSGSEV